MSNPCASSASVTAALRQYTDQGLHDALRVYLRRVLVWVNACRSRYWCDLLHGFLQSILAVLRVVYVLDVPVIFGVLTCLTLEQSHERAGLTGMCLHYYPSRHI